MNGLGIILIAILGVAVAWSFRHMKAIAVEVKRLSGQLDQLTLKVERLERK